MEEKEVVEEPIPKKIQNKTEEELREEIKEELKQEAENKEKQEQLEIKEQEKKHRVGRITLRLFFILLFLFILAETVIGVINMQRLNNNEEPIWYIDSKTEKSTNKTEITYNLGLYVIVKTKEGNETKTTLKPFFLK